MVLRIISTKKVVYNGSADRVSLPGTCGPFTVLYGHAPLISTLVPGDIVYVTEGEEHRVPVTGGIVEVRDNRVSVCVD